jgi:hypothetical protein
MGIVMGMIYALFSVLLLMIGGVIGLVFAIAIGWAT